MAAHLVLHDKHACQWEYVEQQNKGLLFTPGAHDFVYLCLFSQEIADTKLLQNQHLLCELL